MPSDTAFLYLCAGIGWSGLSIVCQCLSTLEKRVDVGVFFIGKLLNSIICLLLGAAAVALGWI
jgi:hypothetical protein